MRLLLDTHLLLWAAISPERLSERALALIRDPNGQPLFSAASIWEVAIKSSLRRGGGLPDPQFLRHALREHDYTELPVTGAHAAAVALLPPIRKDPFDRILIAQAQVEGIPLLTADREVGRYPGPIRLMRSRRSHRETELPSP